MIVLRIAETKSTCQGERSEYESYICEKLPLTEKKEVSMKEYLYICEKLPLTADSGEWRFARRQPRDRQAPYPVFLFSEIVFYLILFIWVNTERSRT